MKTTQTYQTKTYLNSTYLSPLCLARLQGFRPRSQFETEGAEEAMPSFGTRGLMPFVPFVSGVWVWLRLCVYVVTGHGNPFESEFNSEAELPLRPAHGDNRAYRHLRRYCGNQKTMPVIRRYGVLYYFGSRHISPTQFLERRCRLSGVARVSVYRMIYYAHQLVREALWAMFERGDNRALEHGP